MAGTYQKTNELDEMIERLMCEKGYHSDLSNVGLRVQVLYYHNDEQLTHRGVAAYAYVKATSLKERALGQKDATIVVDFASWQKMEGPRREALIDHELYHLTIKKGKDMANEFDDLGRPKIKMRKHDIEFGWFIRIAQEHQQQSIECFQANSLFLSHKQMLFSFLEDKTESPTAEPGMKPVTLTAEAFQKMADSFKK